MSVFWIQISCSSDCDNEKVCC